MTSGWTNTGQPNFPAIQSMLDTYTETGMLPTKVDASQFKNPAGIVAPLE